MTLRKTIERDPEFQALLALSARIGADPALVQAAGGNVSLKRDGVLWIKASGTWLKDAQTQDIMVPVDLPALLAALADGDESAERAQAFVIAEANPSGLRPSIETTVHSAMPQAVVLHVHCVETIAWAALAEAESALAEPLAGVSWVFVPYVRPGLPLSRAIEQRRKAETDVLVLGNHGLVVAAETVEAAEHLLRQVTDRLRREVRVSPPADLARLESLAAGSGFRLPKHERAHGVATDAESCRLAAGGSLYPDHVIFLGPGAVTLRPEETPRQAVARVTGADRSPPTFLLVSGVGVLLADGVSAGAEELAPCLSDVTARIGGEEAVRYLSAAQDRELTDWDAEKYRQHLDRQHPVAAAEPAGR